MYLLIQTASNSPDLYWDNFLCVCFSFKCLDTMIEKYYKPNSKPVESKPKKPSVIRLN